MKSNDRPTQWTTITNPATEEKPTMDAAEKPSRMIDALKTTGKVAIAVGVAGLVQGALSMGTKKGYWSATKEGIAQVAVGVLAALGLGAAGQRGIGAGIGAANAALGANMILEQTSMATMQAPTSTQAPSTMAPAATMAPTMAPPPASALPAGTQAPSQGLPYAQRTPAGARNQRYNPSVTRA